MDQEHQDYADPRPLPAWFESATHRGTLAVVGVAVLLAAARGLYLWYAARP
jgi:hypothetical protein